VEVDSPIEFKLDLDLQLIHRGRVVVVSGNTLLIRDKRQGQRRSTQRHSR